MYELRKQMNKLLEDYSKTYTDKMLEVEETGEFNAIAVSRILIQKHSEAASKINTLLDEFEQRQKAAKKRW